ncbi:MAG: non-canonical purine NTP pyrophosphatase [Burkholderiaceae bacterium]
MRELSRLLAPLGIELLTQDSLGIAPAEEPFPTFIENALAKARHASEASGLPALADDSGICVPALGGAPGVHSARYAALAGRGSGDAANNAHLLEQLGRVTPGLADDQACAADYYCVLVMVREPLDPVPLVAEGRWRGRVIAEPRGSNGFGYDPHFWLAQAARTAAEMTPAEKNAVSHRALAMQCLIGQLRTGWLPAV